MSTVRSFIRFASHLFSLVFLHVYRVLTSNRIEIRIVLNTGKKNSSERTNDMDFLHAFVISWHRKPSQSALHITVVYTKVKHTYSYIRYTHIRQVQRFRKYAKAKMEWNGRERKSGTKQQKQQRKKQKEKKKKRKNTRRVRANVF